MIKKLLRGIALALLPLLAYYALFLAFEPNNYFGLKKQADGTDIMATMRRYDKTPGDRIILGDSRTAKFDPALVQEISGHQWDNLSYGGASFKEQLDMLDWALKLQPDMKQVLFMVSFYPLNKSYNHDRNVVAAAQNPLVYLTSLGYNINMWVNLVAHLDPNEKVGVEDETEDPAQYQYTDYTVPATGQVVQMRTTMARHLGQLAPRTADWELNQKQLDRLLKTIEQCREKGIDFIVVLPPASPEVMQYLVQPEGIDVQMQPVLAALYASGALVLDYEFAPNALRDDQFFDGFHLDLKRGLNPWTQQLFEAIARGGR